jgi:hypothetical protein
LLDVPANVSVEAVAVAGVLSPETGGELECPYHPERFLRPGEVGRRLDHVCAEVS